MIIALVALTFAATLLSQSAMDLFSILLCLWMVGLYIKQRKTEKAFKLFPKTGLEIVWALWFIEVALGYIVNYAVLAPWATRLVEFKWILFLYILLASFNKINWKTLPTLRTIWSILGACSLLGLILFFVRHEPRLESLLNPMTYAHMYGPMLCFAVISGVYLWKDDLRKASDRALWALCMALIGASVFLTFTRGIWIGSFVGILAAGFILHWLGGVFVLASGAVLAGAMFFLWPTFHDRILQVFDYQKNYDLERVTLWKTNWFIFKEHPILGLGYGENSRRLREFYDQLGVPAGQFESHAHNQYLHFLAGTGILGLAIYLFLAGFFLYHSFKLAVSFPEKWGRAVALGCFSGLLCFYVAGFTESNFEHAKVRMIVMFLWGAVLYLRTRSQSS